MTADNRSRSNTRRNRPRPAIQADLLAPKETQSKTQLGVRIAEATHRQLKLAAVIRGVTVQTVVEQAMREFLTNHPEMLRTGPPALQQPSKSTTRTSR